MIFITVGSQKFQFDRLLIEIDKLVASEKIKGEVFAQIGYSQYIPQNYKYKKFLSRKEFNKIINQCNKVITHGGTGSIITALKKDKKVIAIPRKMEYREHVDNHQIQIVEQFKEMGLIEGLEEMYLLEKKINDVDNLEFKKYISSSDEVIATVEQFIEECI